MTNPYYQEFHCGEVYGNSELTVHSEKESPLLMGFTHRVSNLTKRVHTNGK
jgi:hypothetical protein